MADQIRRAATVLRDLANGGVTEDGMRTFDTWTEALAAVGIRDVPPYSQEVQG